MDDSDTSDLPSLVSDASDIGDEVDLSDLVYESNEPHHHEGRRQVVSYLQRLGQSLGLGPRTRGPDRTEAADFEVSDEDYDDMPPLMEDSLSSEDGGDETSAGVDWSKVHHTRYNGKVSGLRFYQALSKGTPSPKKSAQLVGKDRAFIIQQLAALPLVNVADEHIQGALSWIIEEHSSD